MSALVITTSQIVPDTTGSMVDGIAGATILAGPGEIVPAADLAAGWRTTILGVGAASNKLAMSLFVSAQVV